MIYSAFSENPVHQEITDRLLERLDYIRIQPETILVVGLHLDYPLQQLQKRYPSAVIKSMQEITAIENNAYDFIVAHFALLATQEPIPLLQAISNMLRDEGLLFFTTLGPDTLFELRDSFSTVDDCVHTHAFLDMHHMGDWMKQLRFSDSVVDREEITAAYDDLNLLFEDLKNSGISHQNPKRRRSLMSQNQLQKMLLHYAQYKTEEYYPVTLEVIYGHGWKVTLPEAENENEVYISIDAIKRR